MVLPEYKLRNAQHDVESIIRCIMLEPSMMIKAVKFIQNKIESENKTEEDTYAGETHCHRQCKTFEMSLIASKCIRVPPIQ